MPSIDCMSNIDGNGIQYYMVFSEEPAVNSLDLWEGGKCYSFELNHKRQTTEVYSFFWKNGVPSNFNKIKVFNDEILGEKEMIKFVESYSPAVKPGTK